MEVVYHRHAVRYLRRVPADRKQQIKRAIDEVAELDVPTTHPNVRQMAGDWAGCMRLRIGIYRAIFHVTG